MFGPLLPELSRRWDLSDGSAGMLFAAMFFFAIVGACSVTELVRRFDGWMLMVVGFVLVGCGALGLSSSYWQMGYLGASCLGLGLGLVNPPANLAAAAMWPGRNAAALTLLNFFFSVGAMIAPPLIGMSLERGEAQWFPAIYGVLVLGGTTLALRWRLRDLHPPEAPGQAVPKSSVPWRLAISCMVMLFLYVGVEVSLGGWSSTYLLRETDAGTMLAASAPSAFWAAILISRVIAVVILPKVGILPVVAVGSLLTIAGAIAMLLTTHATTSLVAVAVAGFGCGPIFPATVGYFLDYGGPQAARVSGFLFASASVGGAVLPMMVGLASDASGDLGKALWMLPVAAVFMIISLRITVTAKRRLLGQPDDHLFR